MGEIITSITDSFTGVISGMTTGLRESVTGLLFETGTDGARVLSDFAKFGFTMLGFSMAVGIVYLVVRLIRR